MADQNSAAEGERVRLRSYQHEMLDESMKRNVIVAMDTGSGKTHVAIARIQAELERSQPGKVSLPSLSRAYLQIICLTSSSQLVWFMTPSRPLSEQQCRVLQQHLPAYHVKCLTGADDVDKWTDKHLWNVFLAGVHVVVGTPAVLADALTHAFVLISDLSLCVFDEAHRCTKGHPMNKIMSDFYHPAKLRGKETPYILGLSASPVQNRNASKTGLAAVEANLDAITVTPKRFREDLETHVHLPELIKVDYDETALAAGQNSSVCDKLLQEVIGYELKNDPCVLELREQDDAQAKRRLMKVYGNRKTYCTEQLQTLLNRAEHIGTQLGKFMAEWYIRTCLHRYLEGRQNGSSLIDDLESRERRHLESIIGQILSASDSTSAPQPVITSASDKAKKLHDILLQNAKTGLRSIIFVEQRAMVVALAHMLQTPALAKLYNIGTFVGNSGHSSRKTLLGDLVDLRTQDQDLQDFRDGKKNLMIATNVLEEGIDIPVCNGVICFDLPKSLISFVQRKGRAREADSKYILFVARGDLDADPSKWRQLEEKMKEAYMDEKRSTETTSGAEASEEDTSSVRYSVPSTGALLTMENARGHLHHFCAVARRASRYVDPRPEFDTQELPEIVKMWTASVTLPSFVHPSVRTAKSSQTWRGERNAIKDAAFNAYVALHRAGLVNDHLLPAVKDLGPKPGDEHADQPSLIEVDEQLSAWRLCGDAEKHQSITWYAAEVKLRLSNREVLSQTLWLPFQVEAAESIRLYWNENVCYEASVRPSHHETLDDVGRNAATAWTSLVLKSVFASRMPADNVDFAFLLSQPSDQSENDISGPYTGLDAICQHLASKRDYADCGVVRVADQIGRAFILQGIEDVNVKQPPGSEHIVQEKHLVVTPFPKRRDFLHVVSNNDQVSATTAYTSRQLFPVSKCTIDRLPVDYSLLGVFLPSILHHLDVAFVARHLSTGILRDAELDDMSLVLEAISAPVAKEQAGDYNRLEYLGDCILKFCTEVQVLAQHLTWPEGFLSREKDRIVRNTNLADAALDVGLAQFVLTKPFTGSKWRPSHLRELIAAQEVGQREVSSKVLADVVESLIGAAYFDGGLQKAFICIQTMLPKEMWWTHDAALDAILEESQPSNANLELLEKLVGHKFNRPSLLLEAITHASHYDKYSSMSYERLEFLGDAVLDLIVTPKLYDHERKLRHWDLHRIHEALVNGHFLGFCCMTLSGEQETFDIVDTSAARGKPQKEARPRTRTYHLHDFIRASGELPKARDASIARFNTLRDPIDTALQSGSLYPWPDLIALRPEKFFSDIIESILGALFLDTRGDLDVCEAFLEKLGVLLMLRRILDEEVETTFPKERVGILADRKDVKYVATQGVEDDEGVWECVVLVDQSEVIRVGGCGSKEEAEVRAADMAAAKLGEHVGVSGNRKRRKLAVRGEGGLGYT
jgi:ERCC4-related helicase/dsRNA-specific ribonuclease